MESIQIKENGKKAEIFIDGQKIDGITHIKIEKTAGEGTNVEIRAFITGEVLAEI